VIINHTYKYIFVKTTKTAGTSLEIALSRSCGPSDVVTPFGAPDDNVYRESLDGYQTPCNYENLGIEEHSRASVISKAISPHIWKDYFKFAIIRDPVDYAISRYYWDNRSKLPKGKAPSIDDWLRADKKKINHNWRIHSIGNEPAMDYYIIYDHLTEDASRVSEMLRLDYDLGEDVKSIQTKHTIRKKQNPIECNDTYDFIRKNSVRETELIRKLKKERDYNG